MKECPILFKDEMVRAILDGRKTQTRRLVKLPKNHVWGSFFDGQICPENDLSSLGYSVDELRCPYGKPSDRLWVRETWYCDHYRVQRGPYLKPDDMDLDTAQRYGLLVYRASNGEWMYEAEQPVWRPSIHMPRWASRITLEITSVRVERLQDISEKDAKAEGAEPAECCHAHYHGFGKLWESINGPDSWDANPWVWVVEFKRVQP